LRDSVISRAPRAFEAIFVQSFALIVSRGAIHEPPMAAMSGSFK
jgi:hypothetical protein